MRNVIVHYGIAVAILLFAASPFIMATADGMVIYFLGVALIASVSLALANRPSEHVLGWTLTFASIYITIACWASAVHTFRGRILSGQEQAITALSRRGRCRLRPGSSRRTL